MKKIIFLSLLLPLFAFSQERQIGTYSGGVYSFNWNMKAVVQHAMPTQTIDSVFVQDTAHLAVVFIHSGNIYYDWMKFTVINGDIFTSASSGCLNSCKKLDCSKCSKTPACECSCTLGSICEAVNLGIFINTNVSNGIRNYILTHSNP